MQEVPDPYGGSEASAVSSELPFLRDTWRLRTRPQAGNGSGASCVHPDLPYRVGVRSRHVSRRHGRGLMREPSAGRRALPSHLMLAVEACSAAAARGAAFVRPHCVPRITKIHSAAAPAQSPSAALIGYDGTTLFHHATYAASYTTRSATWQATPLATTGAVPTRQRLNMLNGGLQEQAKISGERSPLPATP